MRQILPDLRFNELLNDEARMAAEFYRSATHYEPFEYVRIVGPAGASLQELIGPGDRDLVKLMRRLGARLALSDAPMDPLAIFVVQAALAIRMDDLGATPQRTITIYGVTNDARSNLAVLPAQWDEDGRLYAEPTEIYHWGGEGRFSVDVLPYVEFFRAFDDVGMALPVPSGAVELPTS